MNRKSVHRPTAIGCRSGGTPSISIRSARSARRSIASRDLGGNLPPSARPASALWPAGSAGRTRREDGGSSDDSVPGGGIPPEAGCPARFLEPHHPVADAHAAGVLGGGLGGGLGHQLISCGEIA